MAPWTQCSKFGVAIYNYDNFKLCVGDTIHISQETEEWYYGRHIQSRAIFGMYPKSVLFIKECVETKLGNLQTVMPKEVPMVQEITSVLRDWGTLYRNLYLNNKDHYCEVKKSIFHLIEWRRAIMSKKLTNDELKDHYRKVNSQIDRCNRILGLDLIVRNEEGKVINPDRTNTLQLYHRHKETAQQLKKTRQEHRVTLLFFRKATESDLRPNQRHTLNLFVTVRNFVCRVGDDADVFIGLYDSQQGCFFSESYVVKWSQEGLPKDLDMLNNIRILFTDLGSKDMRNQRECVYLVCRVVRVGNMFAQELDGSSKQPPKSNQIMRRPFGVAVLDVTDILNGDNRPDDEKQYFVPFVPCDSKDCLEALIKDSLKNAEDVNSKTAKGQGLWVSLKLLEGSSQQVKEDNPLLVASNASIARKMGFPEVIMPSDVRNDFYVTIRQGDFSLKAARDRLRDRNIEVTMEVCSGEGQIVQDVISMGAGSPLMSSYQSIVYRHEEKPRWFETIKVVVPISDFYNCHLRFLFKHRSQTDAKDRQEKPFAMAYAPFVSKDGTTINDGIHNLYVYAIDQKRKSKEITQEYKNLPSSELEIRDRSGVKSSSGPYTYSPKEAFSMNTLVCSTKLTHNAVVLGLLNWRSNLGTLKQNLQRLRKVDGEEVVKFLQDILDVLFSIIMQKPGSDDYGNLVFDALTFIISLIGDRKYHQFRPVVETYLGETFCATLAYEKLLESFTFLVNNANDPAFSNSLYQSIKCFEFLMKFTIRSRLLFARMYENKASPQFEMALRMLLEAFNQMMQYTADHTLKVQGAALKYMPLVVTDVVTCFDRMTFARLFVQFIDNVPERRLLAQKIQCLLDIVQSDLFCYPDSRKLMLQLINKHVGEAIKQRDQQDRQRDQQDKILSLSAKVLSDVLIKLSALPPVQTREDIKIIITALLRIVMHTVIYRDKASELGRDYVSIMIALLRQMEEAHYIYYFNHFDTPIDLLDFLMEIVLVFRDLIRQCVYPADWNDMIMVQNSVLLKALRYIAHTIKEKCSVPFTTNQYQLWNNFFHCAISFLTQPALQLENFSEAKRNRIIGRYKDMRMEMGAEIRTMWYNLGQHKFRFIPEMVGPIVEMTLIPEKELRKSTIPIFFDMMQCEFTQIVPGTANQLNGRFTRFENEMITQLDQQVEGGNGDEEYRQLFVSIIRDRCANHQIMHDSGLQFVEVVSRLLLRLLEYRTIICHENQEHRMNCIVNLLNFYRDIDRQEMYIRYLHKLRSLHLVNGNYTEAAYTLMLYTKLLRWTTEPLEPHLLSDLKDDEDDDTKDDKKDDKGSQNTHRELKENLYETILKNLERGQMWEAAIEICKELAIQYEQEMFDYKKLSEILIKQAGYYKHIMKQPRPTPMYFRVGYFGKGFPPFLRNKTFVYLGGLCEGLGDFTFRIQNQFVDAQLLKTLETPPLEIQESPHKYLLINKVEPIYHAMKRFEGKAVPERILSYWKNNEIQQFSFCKSLTQSQDVTKLWLETTNLVTSYPLPGILRWFQVSSEEKYKLSPIENAIKTMQDATQQLQAAIEDVEADSTAIQSLNMRLQGMVEAKVNMGITNYKVFYTGAYLEGKPPDQKARENISRLKSCTTHQTVLLSRGLDLFGRKSPSSMQPMYRHLISEFEHFVSFIQEYGMTPPEEVITMHKMKRSASHAGDLDNLQMTTLQPISTPSDRKRPKSLVFSFPSMDIKKSVGNTKSMLSISQLRNSKPNLSKSRSNSKILSEISTDSRDSSSDTDRGDVSSNSVIELTQQLTTARPKRPESRGGRGGGRPSSHCSNQSTSSSLSTAKSMPLLNGGGLSTGPAGGGANLPKAAGSPANQGSIDEDCPPPLPVKITYADYSNLDAIAPAPGQTTNGQERVVSSSGVTLRANSHKGRPAPPLPMKNSSTPMKSTNPSVKSAGPPVPAKKPSGPF